ncbi:MAG: hypothetical protein ACK4F8_14420, partial [Aquabacterium sp.]
MTRHQIETHRHVQLEEAQLRLNSVHDSLEQNFRQLSALSRALGRQNTVTQFLGSMRIEWSSTLPEPERIELGKALAVRDDVRRVSHHLREMVTDFQVGQIYVIDPVGT